VPTAERLPVVHRRLRGTSERDGATGDETRSHTARITALISKNASEIPLTINSRIPP
jgi:hypothetical protein